MPMTDQPTERVASELVERIARAIRDDKDCRGRGEYEASLLLAAAINEAVAKERAGIVAWLREQAALRFRLADEREERSAIVYNQTRGIAVEMAADAIERGEHKEQSA